MKSAIIVLLLAVVAPAQTYSTRHYKQVVALTLDATRIAVLRPDSDVLPALLPAVALAAHGIAPDAVRDMPLGGGALVTLPPGRSAADLVAAVASDGSRLFAAPVFLDQLGGPIIPTPEVLLRFEVNASADAQRAVLDALAAATGAFVEVGPGWAGLENAYKLRVPTHDGFDVLEIANALAGRSDVRFATPNWISTGRSGALPTNDPLFGDSWALNNTGQTGGTPDEDMDAPEAWDITTGDAGVIVVVIDDGVEQDHPDIAQVGGKDFVGQSSGGDAFNTCDNHGTAVAGCISSIMNNGLGTVGMSPGCRVASARAMKSKVTSPCGVGEPWTNLASSTPEALEWAESIGARVTNNSNFYNVPSPAIEDAYAHAKAAGMVHFAAAGNSATSFIEYPASLPDVLAVSATDHNGALASFSSWGTGLDLSAPGDGIMSTDRTGSDGYYAGDYGLMHGTSFSSPFCAGVAALVISRNPSLSAEQVESILLNSAVDHGALGYDDVYGFGVVNAERALLCTPKSAWTDLGSGLAGVVGIPLLAGTGSLETGTPGTLTLSDAAPSAPAALFISAADTPTPFKGGVLSTVPIAFQLPVGTFFTGSWTLPWSAWPAGVPSGSELYFQVGVSDASAVKGVAISNLLKATQP